MNFFYRLGSAISLAFAGLAITVILGEIASRSLLPPVPSVFTPEALTSDNFTATTDSPVQDDTILQERIDESTALFVGTPTGRRLRPMRDVTIQNHYLCKCSVQVKTNSLGYRSPEIGPKDPNRKRVLFLGDSITLADYIPEEKTWVRQIEQLSQHNAQPYETINAGVWAIGLANELAILKETGLSTNPDIVVLAFYLNDVEPSPGISILRPPPYMSRSALAKQVFYRLSLLFPEFEKEEYSSLPNEVVLTWQKETERQFPPGPSVVGIETDPAAFNKTISELIFDWGSAWSDSAWNYMEPMLEELYRQSVIHNFSLRIIVFPVENQVSAEYLYDYPQQKMSLIAGRLGVPLLDLLPLFRKKFSREANQRMFYDWCHHTPYGQDLIAQWVYQFLRQ